MTGDLLGYLAVGSVVVGAAVGSLAMLALPSGRRRRHLTGSARSPEPVVTRARTTAPPDGAPRAAARAPAGRDDQSGPGDLTWGGMALGALLVLGSTERGVQLAAGLLLVLVPAAGVLVVGCAYRDARRR